MLNIIYRNDINARLPKQMLNGWIDRTLTLQPIKDTPLVYRREHLVPMGQEPISGDGWTEIVYYYSVLPNDDRIIASTDSETSKNPVVRVVGLYG